MMVGASGGHGGLWDVVVVFGRLLWAQEEVVVVFRGSDASRVEQPSPAVGKAEWWCSYPNSTSAFADPFCNP